MEGSWFGSLCGQTIEGVLVVVEGAGTPSGALGRGTEPPNVHTVIP